MDELTPKDRFLRSLGRCSRDENFIPSFYDRFLANSDEIREKFRHTNFEKQNEMLLRSLRLAAGATAGEPESLREIRERAETHDRNHLNIEPRLYDIWLSSVLDAAREFDAEWDDAIEDAWNTILDHVIKYMVRYYYRWLAQYIHTRNQPITASTRIPAGLVVLPSGQMTVVISAHFKCKASMAAQRLGGDWRRIPAFGRGVWTLRPSAGLVQSRVGSLTPVNWAKTWSSVGALNRMTARQAII